MQLSRISESEQYHKQSANGALVGDRHRLRWWFYFSLLRMSENPPRSAASSTGGKDIFHQEAYVEN